MKLHVLLFWSTLALVSCTETQPANNNLSAPTSLPLAEQAPAAVVAAPDMYVGVFYADDKDKNQNNSYSNKITLAIESLENGVIKGYSVVAGNSRPFQGSYTEANNVVSAKASEPGDDQYDGVFTFNFFRDSQQIEGTWKANVARKGSVSLRNYILTKRVFKYDPNLSLQGANLDLVEFYATQKDGKNGDSGSAEYITDGASKFNASTTLLKPEDVENMYKGDLEVIRNAIYARHGYSFKNRRMRYVFDKHVDWYMPVSTNITQDLTEIEKKNIDLLKRYEQHAEAYYDAFGR
jgi:hypothetical protein